MMMKHFIGAAKIRNDQINNFLIPAAIAVDDSWIVIVLIFDGFFHSG